MPFWKKKTDANLAEGDTDTPTRGTTDDLGDETDPEPEPDAPKQSRVDDDEQPSQTHPNLNPNDYPTVDRGGFNFTEVS